MEPSIRPPGRRDARPIDGFFPQRKLRESGWSQEHTEETRRGKRWGRSRSCYRARKFLSARLDTATAALVAASPRLSRDIVVLFVYLPPRGTDNVNFVNDFAIWSAPSQRTNKASWEWRFDVCIMVYRGASEYRVDRSTRTASPEEYSRRRWSVKCEGKKGENKEDERERGRIGEIVYR